MATKLEDGPLLIIRAEHMVVVDKSLSWEELDDHLGRAVRFIESGGRETEGLTVIDAVLHEQAAG